MIFQKLEFDGVHVIELEKIVDQRGFFVRSWDKDVFQQKRLNYNIVQCNISFNKIKGTIRGLHYQIAPYEEVKFVRCVSGKAYEVFVDLRKDSKTFLKWGGVKLDSAKLTSIYVPEGFALGFQTLEDNTELFYQMSQFYKPEYSRGIIWNDENLKIKWPVEMTVMSEKDLSLPNLVDVLNGYHKDEN